ncbi:hypothetical protein FKM82_006689 [Ascaphus truei]
MQVSFTETSIGSNGSTESLDLILVTCTSGVSSTSTGVGEENEWNSFYTSFKTEQLVTLWILFIITMVGNSIVLYLTWKERKRKSRMTFFVTQLAITVRKYYDVNNNKNNFNSNVTKQYWVLKTPRCTENLKYKMLLDSKANTP